MVWSMLGYHGGGRFMSDLKPAFYRIHSNGLLSSQTRERQQYMTAIAYMHLAAYHEEQSDREAAQAALQSTLFHSRSMLGSLPAEPTLEHFDMLLPGLPPKRLFKLWRRALKHRLLGR